MFYTFLATKNFAIVTQLFSAIFSLQTLEELLKIVLEKRAPNYFHELKFLI